MHTHQGRDVPRPRNHRAKIDGHTMNLRRRLRKVAINQKQSLMTYEWHPKVSARSAPIGKDPDFREVFVFAIVPVIGSEHFPQLLGEFVRLARGVGVMLARLVVADTESRAAAIAELE